MDSDISEKIQLKGIEKGITFLAIHDGFLAEDIHEEQGIIDIMKDAYEEVMKTRDIKIDIKGKTSEQLDPYKWLSEINLEKKEDKNIYMKLK